MFVLILTNTQICMWRDPCNGIKSKLIWNVINVLLDQYSAHVIRFCYTMNKKIMDYRCMPWKIKMVYHYIVRYWKNGALHASFVISQIQISIVLICRSNPWWRHQMETFSTLLALCVGNSPVTGEFPVQKPVTRSFSVLFDLRLNKRLSKQSKRRWFETPSRSLLRHCNTFLHWGHC